MMGLASTYRREALTGVLGALVALSGCTNSSDPPGGAREARPPGDAGSPDGITVTFYPCPTVASLSAAPSAIDRDATAMVSAQTVIPDGGMLVWTAPSGSFSDPGATDTTYSCATPGMVTLTATVTYMLCKHSETVMVTCL
jgi:hypothetical protein